VNLFKAPLRGLFYALRDTRFARWAAPLAQIISRKERKVAETRRKEKQFTKAIAIRSSKFVLRSGLLQNTPFFFPFLSLRSPRLGGFA